MGRDWPGVKRAGEGGVGEEVNFEEGNTIPSYLANEKGLAFPAGPPVPEVDPENRVIG